MRLVIATAAFTAVASFASPVLAGPATDDFSKCVVAKAAPDDQIVLEQWMFAQVALNPAVKSISTVNDQQRDAANKKAGALFQRLLFTDCHAEAVAALKTDGNSAVGAGFSALGQIAGRGLIGNPAVTNGVKDLIAYIDLNQVAQLMKEGGALGAPPAGAATPASATTPAP